jgi:hypothetical protein
MKAYRGSRGIALLVLCLGVRSGERNTPVSVFPVKEPSARWIGGWVGPRAGLDVWEKRKSLAPAGIRAPDHSTHNV